jgi:hypothetical protein
MKILRYVLCAMLFAIAIPAHAAFDRLEFCAGLPSSDTVEVYVYDMTDAAVDRNWTSTGVTEKANGNGFSTYWFTVPVDEAHSYDVKCRTTIAATQMIAAFGITRLETSMDALISTRLATAGYTAPPTASSVADAVLDEAMADHLGAGTTGEKLNAAGNAGDPWISSLGTYTVPGTAGYILGQVPSGVTVNPAQITAGVLSGVITQGSSVTWLRGDANRMTVSLGSAYAKSGARFYLAVKASKTADNTTALVNREVTITDAATVAGYIDLISTETSTVGTYYAEIERRDADGTSNPRTCWQAVWKITQDVRQ